MSNLDDTYRGQLADTFENFEVPPHPRVWSGVEQGMGISEPRGEFANTFSGFETVPGLKVWDNIEADLRANPPRRRRRVAGWYWAAAAGVALLIGSIWVISNQSNQQPGSFAEESVQPGQTPGFQAPAPPIRPAHPGAHYRPGAEASLYGDDNTQSDVIAAQESTTAGGRQRNTSNGNVSNGALAEQNTNRAARTSTLGQLPVAPVLDAEQLIYPQPLTVAVARPFQRREIESPIKSRNQAALRMATAFQPAGAATEIYNTTSRSTFDAALESTANNNGEGQSVAGYGSPTFQTPIVYDLTADLPLNHRWSIETGLSYTQMRSSSNGLAPGPNGTQSLETTLNYIGIPVLSRVRLAGRRKLRLSSAQGVHLEKPISGRFIQSINQNGKGENTIKDDRSGLPGWQGSIVAGLDFEYKFSKRIGFHVRPQASLYVKHHDNVYNARTQQRVWPSLQTGLRIHFD